MRVAVVGSNGLIGRHLVAGLVARGDGVVAVSRTRREAEGAEAIAWDPERSAFPADVAGRVDAIVNLAGAPIGPGRWTAARRARILQSRVGTTRAIVEAIARGGPTVLCNASAVGVYGSSEQPLDESSPPGAGFLAQVCTRWEREALEAREHARVVVLRTSLVLARDGGALPPLVTLAKMGLAGRIGTGRQWMSWIHLRDEVDAIMACLADGSIDGPVNLVTGAVRQRDFARALARQAHRRGGLPLPAAAVHLALGEAASLLLDGQQVVAARLSATGFAPTFPTLDAALGELLGGTTG